MHDHAHHAHAHARDANRARLAWTLGLTLCYMVAEIVGGYLSGSLALLADAGHMFSDAAALANEWVHLPNRNPVFAGEAPLAYMIRGGLPALQTVRRLLDSRRAG